MVAKHQAPVPTGNRIFGFEIGYLTGWFAVLGFCGSIASLLWHGYNAWQGPQVKLITPDQVTIASSENVGYPNRDYDKPYVHFIARLSSVNEAGTGYNATVSGEYVRVTVKGQGAFESHWYNFVSSDAGGTDGAKLVVKKEAYAHPYPLAAGAAESHETLFQPRPKDCTNAASLCSNLDNYIEWEKFVVWLRDKRSVDFEFFADTFSGPQPASVKCTVAMDQLQFDRMVQRRWASPICTPKK